VEDEVLIRMALAAALRDADFVVIEAGNASEALEVLRARPDITALITDIFMPGQLDGAEVIRIVRRDFSGISIIAASAVAMDVDADAFVLKPYRDEQIVALVQRMTRKVLTHG